jgi:hypothetical protein
MSGTHQLRLCSTHAAHMGYWFTERQELALGHMWRLWIDRGLPCYRRILRRDEVYDEGRAMEWLHRNCWTVSAGCPICHDPQPSLLLTRIHRAVEESLLSLAPRWRIGQGMALRFAYADGRAAYIAPLTALEERKADDTEAWWN